MASHLSCIGFDGTDLAGFDALIAQLRPGTTYLGSVHGLDVHRWDDPSGARVILGIQDGELIDFLPSFAGRPGVHLDDCRRVNGYLVAGDVLDEDGHQTTRMSFELEQRRALAEPGSRWSGRAAVTAFGRSADFFADADAFARSPQGLLDPNAAETDAPPGHLERGFAWPPRMAPESFLPYGAFASDEDADAGAGLNGVVVHAERRRNSLTGRPFLVSRVRCLGAELDLVSEWSDDDEVPAPGAVVAANVFLVASIGELDLTPPPATASAVAPAWRGLFGRRR